MNYRITLYSGFRSAIGQRGLKRLWHPGVYAVPGQMPAAVAAAALAGGNAEKHQEPPKPIPGIEDPVMAEKVEAEFLRVQGQVEPEPETEPEPGPAPEHDAKVEPADDDADDKPKPRVKRRYTRRSKGRAPENKSGA